MKRLQNQLRQAMITIRYYYKSGRISATKCTEKLAECRDNPDNAQFIAQAIRDEVAEQFIF